jgi:hypothetical protein
VSVDEGIRAFWEWWSTARHRLVNAIEVERAFAPDLVNDITAYVKAIGDLDWEVSPGTTAKHGFCLSSKGEPEGRLVTELWRERGPASDETWEYFAARQPGHGTVIRIYDVDIDRDDLIVAFDVDTGRERVDARFFHPLFRKLDDDQPSIALYLLLDNTFGEDGVERWLGHIEAVAKKPKDGVPFGEFEAAVAELARTATGERFAILKGETETGLPVIISVNQAIKRIDHLLYSMHVVVDLAILDENQGRMCTPEDGKRLGEIEDELGDALGSTAVWCARETRAGRRVIHWYAPEDSAAQGILERWAAKHADRDPQIVWIRDPAWEFARRFA